MFDSAVPFGPSDKKLGGQILSGDNVEVRVTTQGGRSVIARLDPVAGSFNRIIDESSRATVTLISDWGNRLYRKSGIDLCGNLNQICIGKQELEFRIGNKVLWAGPIQYISWTNDTIVIEAEDNTSWWAARVLPRINLATARDLSDIVRVYHDSAMEINPVQGFTLITSPAGEFAEAIVTIDDKRTALDAIDEIADFGIDYTALGRVVLAGPPTSFPTLQYQFSDNSFQGGLKVEKHGPRQGFATRIIAFGEQDEAPVIVQADEATLATYGVIERVVEFRQLTNGEDLTKAARAYLRTFSQPFYVASEQGALLRPGIPVPCESLVPGVKIRVSLNESCRPLQALLRLREVTFDLATGFFGLSLEPTSAAFGDTELTEVVG